MFDHFAARSVLLVAIAMVAALTALAGPASDPERINPVIGEKLDSGLGDLPVWRPGADPVTQSPERSSVAAAQ